jgi:hypothetical protein
MSGFDPAGTPVPVIAPHSRFHRDVALIDAAQPEGFQMPDKRTVTAARLGKRPDAAQVRDQRHHRCPWRRIEISLAALEIGSLTYALPALPTSGL